MVTLVFSKHPNVFRLTHGWMNLLSGIDPGPGVLRRHQCHLEWERPVITVTNSSAVTAASEWCCIC
jgi:hypothetical protein